MCTAGLPIYINVLKTTEHVNIHTMKTKQKILLQGANPCPVTCQPKVVFFFVIIFQIGDHFKYSLLITAQS